MADWYEVVPSGTPLSQGDLITGLLLPSFSDFDAREGRDKLFATVTRLDAIVLTQACDLEQNNVKNVLLCGAPLAAFVYDGLAKANGMTAKAWGKELEKIRKGENKSKCYLGPHMGEPATDVRLADFRTLHTVPRSYLEKILQGGRLRLTSDYRNHVNNCFGGFITRIALP